MGPSRDALNDDSLTLCQCTVEINRTSSLHGAVSPALEAGVVRMPSSYR